MCFTRKKRIRHRKVYPDTNVLPENTIKETKEKQDTSSDILSGGTNRGSE